MRCVSFCTARSYNLSGLSNFFKSKGYQTRTYRTILHVRHTNNMQDIFFFAGGCIVSWNLKRKEELQMLDDIKEFSITLLEKVETDRFVFRLGDATKIRTHDSFNVDMITLESDSTQLKLAISYGLAQSIKLEAYEEIIQKTTQKNERLSIDLASNGKITLSRKAISKRMGEIFIERSSVNLSSEYLDMPEYFWQYPSLEAYYIMTEKFLDVPRRVAALNHKLDVLHELFNMLTSQLQHRHSSLLESIIIILIVVEILISIFHWNLPI